MTAKTRRQFSNLLWPAPVVVQRLVDAVKIKGIEIDAGGLRADLHQYRVEYVTYVSETKTRQRARKKLAQKVSDHAGWLFQTIAQPPDRTFDNHLWPLGSITRDQLLAGLGALRDAARIDPVEPSSAPKAWAIKRLVQIYEKHFKDRAGVSRNATGALIGPFIRFCQKVASETGTDFSSETIASALAQRAQARG